MAPSSGTVDNIKVAIRVRPLNNAELRTEQSDRTVWEIEPTRITSQLETGKVDTFSFDHVFGSEVDTASVYEATSRPIIEGVLTGINGTVFAYGQTSSGKTYTMMGSQAQPGIVRRAVADVFAHIAADRAREYLVRTSFMEIYNEVVNDLLSPGKINLSVIDDGARVIVADVTERIVTSPEQVLDLLAAGEGMRHIGRTNMNDVSSRSHTIFRLVLESRPLSGKAAAAALSASAPASAPASASAPLPLPPGAPSGLGPVLTSTLFLVDLAGSERLSKTQAVGMRAREGAMINKSLLTLGKVISILSKGRSREHVPFRESKLTRILRPSLEGSARVSVVCNCSPALLNYDETVSTLRFASAAKLIRTRATVNEVLDDKSLIQRLRNEISELQLKLQSAREEAEKHKADADVLRRSSSSFGPMLAQARRTQGSLDGEGGAFVSDGSVPGIAVSYGSGAVGAAASAAGSGPAGASSMSSGPWSDGVGVPSGGASLGQPAQSPARSRGGSFAVGDVYSMGGGSEMSIPEMEATIQRLNRLILSSSAMANRATEEKARQAVAVNVLEEELRTLRDVNKSKDQRLQAALERIRALQAVIEERDDQMLQYEARIAVYMEEIDRLQRLVVMRDGELAALRQENTELAAKARDAPSSDLVNELIAKLELAQRDVARLQLAQSTVPGAGRLLMETSESAAAAAAAAVALHKDKEPAALPSFMSGLHEATSAREELRAQVARVGNAHVRQTLEQIVDGGDATISLGWQCLGDDAVAELLSFGARALGAVVSLNLEWNRMTDKMGASLSGALATMALVDTLLLGGNCLGDKGVEQVASVLDVLPNLRVLDLKWNRVRDAGAIALARRVGVCAKLERLDLGKNWFGDAAIEELAAPTAVARLPVLQSLDVCRSRITNAAAPALCRLVQSAASAVTVSLWGTKLSTDALSEIIVAATSSRRGCSIVSVEPAGESGGGGGGGGGADGGAPGQADVGAAAGK